ncbi:MAG: hypothetical protein ACLUD0_20370 [Eubacterium ramulus]
MSSRKELAGVWIDICSLREALHKIEHYLASEVDFMQWKPFL